MTYTLLPFRFTRVPESDRYLATNFVGQCHLLSRADLQAIVKRQLDTESTFFADLVASHFVTSENSTAALHLLAAKYRTRRQLFPDLTALHIFVVTLRCNHKCLYCHAVNVTLWRVSRLDPGEANWGPEEPNGETDPCWVERLGTSV